MSKKPLRLLRFKCSAAQRLIKAVRLCHYSLLIAVRPGAGDIGGRAVNDYLINIAKLIIPVRMALAIVALAMTCRGYTPQRLTNRNLQERKYTMMR